MYIIYTEKHKKNVLQMCYTQKRKSRSWKAEIKDYSTTDILYMKKYSKAPITNKANTINLNGV